MYFLVQSIVRELVYVRNCVTGYGVLLSESLASAGLVFIAIAMSKLEATVVSAISAVQPVFVTILELVLLRDSRPVCSLTGLVLHFVALKILPITGIVVGVVLLTISETAL